MFLIINTSSEKNYILVSTTKDIIGKISWRVQTYQSQVLLPQIDKLIRYKKIRLNDFKTILVYQGPGSYTGLRVGISVANALAFSLNIPVIGTKKKNIHFLKINKKLKTTEKKYVIPYYEN